MKKVSATAIQQMAKNDYEKKIEEKIFKVKTTLKKKIQLNGRNSPEVINRKTAEIISGIPGVNLKSVNVRGTNTGVKIYPVFTIGASPITYSPTISMFTAVTTA